VVVSRTEQACRRGETAKSSTRNLGPRMVEVSSHSGRSERSAGDRTAREIESRDSDDGRRPVAEVDVTVVLMADLQSLARGCRTDLGLADTIARGQHRRRGC